MFYFVKFLLILLFMLVFPVGFVTLANAQTPTENLTSTLTPSQTPTPSGSVTPTEAPNNDNEIRDLQNRIKEYEAKLNELQGAKKTLSSQIAIMNNQIKLTELRISGVEKEIADLQKDIDITKQKVVGIEKNLTTSTNALIERIDATYKAGKVGGWQIFLTSDTITNYFNRLKYHQLMQIADKRRIYAAEQAKVSYENQQSILLGKQTKAKQLQETLEGYTVKLSQDKDSKQKLLSVTQNDEEKYQKLLRDARAQINAFKSFSAAAGGVQILPPQASPDGWYYNQRDERWGRNRMGNSSEQVWDVGCLATSVAMVMKQKGINVTPADIAADSSNFFSDTAYMLIPWVSGKFQSVWQQDLGAIDARLANGDPVIVGVRAGVYGQHFIVLKSGSGGSYTMNDPWYGANLNFSDHYTTSQIFQYGYYK